jgi:hypothetical protein
MFPIESPDGNRYQNLQESYILRHKLSKGQMAKRSESHPAFCPWVLGTSLRDKEVGA